MADNVILNSMSGGDTCAADEIAGIKFQRMKLIHGADGVNAGDVSTANGLPVQVLSIAAGDNNIGNVDIVSSALPTGAATEATLSALNGKVTACDTGAVVVSSSALPTGAATSAKQDSEITILDAIATLLASGIAVSDGGGILTVDGSVTVSGTVAFSNTTIAVTNAGTFPVQVSSALPAGDNNIGNVDVVTLPALPTGTNSIGNIGTVSTVTTVAAVTAITNALPAGTNNIGDVDILSIAAGDNNIGNVDVVTLPALPAGTNNIGDVDVLTLPALPAGTNNIGDVDVLTQPARSRTVDAISVAQQTDALMDGLTALTPKFAKISAAASGDNTLVTAVTSKKIRVLSLFMMAAGTVNAYIRDDAGTPVNLIGDATNKLTLVSSSGFVLPYNPLGWCETTSGEGLQLNLSAAIGVAGCLTYVEV